MPILRDWKCDDCDHEFESTEWKPLCPNPRKPLLNGQIETCDGLTHMLPVASKSYTIQGDNSASTKPQKSKSTEK